MNKHFLMRITRKLKHIYDLMSNRAIILAYHRVAHLKNDSQLLAVSPENFEQHLAIISRKYIPISLAELAHDLTHKSIRHKAVIITFDDGYVDNLMYAKPLLARYKIPATVFVITGLMGKHEELWWDELERVLLLPAKLPRVLNLKINNQAYAWDLSDDGGGLLAYSAWNVTVPMKMCARFNLYKDLHKLLRPLPHNKIQEVLEQIRLIIGISHDIREGYRVCTTEEVQELNNGGLVEIGAHTVTHPVLSHCTLAIQKNEIEQSKHVLEAILAGGVRSFSYPYGGLGDIGENAVTLARDAGYSCAVANYTGWVTKTSTPYLLPRFLVRNWDGAFFERQLKEWFGG